MKLEVDNTLENWEQVVLSDLKDTIFLSNDSDEAIWFSSFVTQKIINKGGFEVIPIYGKLIDSLADFIYQVNCSLPTSYKVGADLHSLYDCLLNFETEPKNRVFLWNDADYLFLKNRGLFEQIAEEMLSAGYLNSHGLASIKEDGKRYRVEQVNFFFIKNLAIDALSDFMNKEYELMSLDHQPDGLKKKIEFKIVNLDG